MWAFGGLTTLMFVARIAFRLFETPKYLLGKDKNAAAAAVVQQVARRDGKETRLTATHFDLIDEQLGFSIPESEDANATSKNIVRRNLARFTPQRILKLFSTPRQALSTTLMLFLWCSIGMAYPLCKRPSDIATRSMNADIEQTLDSSPSTLSKRASALEAAAETSLIETMRSRQPAVSRRPAWKSRRLDEKAQVHWPAF